jgi:hypothetical protein
MLCIELRYLLRASLANGQDESPLHSSTTGEYICDFLLANRQFVVAFLIHQHNPHASGVVSRAHKISKEPNPVGVPVLQLSPIQSQLTREFLDFALLEGSKEDPEFGRGLDIHLFVETDLT